VISALGWAALPPRRLRAQSQPKPDLDRVLPLFDFEADARTRISHGARERLSGFPIILAPAGGQKPPPRPLM